MITVQYMKKGWFYWCFWPCRSEAEAEQVRSALRDQGYEVRGSNSVG